MWPSRFVLPSNPRYSAGARASRSATPGDPSSERTSGVVSRIRGWARGVNRPGDGGTTAFEIGRPSSTQAP